MRPEEAVDGVLVQHSRYYLRYPFIAFRSRLFVKFRAWYLETELFIVVSKNCGRHLNSTRLCVVNGISCHNSDLFRCGKSFADHFALLFLYRS